MRLFVFIFVMFVNVLANAVELHWVQLPDSPHKLVVIVEEGQSPIQSLEKYIETMEQDSELKDFIHTLKNTNPTLFQWGRIALSWKKKVLLLANNRADMSTHPNRVMNFQATFKEAGADVFVLPVAALKSVASSDRSKALDEISKQMNVVTAMGGDDIDPAIYDEENTDSYNVNKERDRFEAMLLDGIIKRAQAFVFGVCRGHQLVAALQGLKLIQDISGHRDGKHYIYRKKSTHNLFHLFSGIRAMAKVNSIHHQAVDYKEGSPMELVAISDDHTPEVLEFKNGRGLTVQFHPEMMSEDWAKELMKNVVWQSSIQNSNSCESLLSAS